MMPEQRGSVRLAAYVVVVAALGCAWSVAAHAQAAKGTKEASVTGGAEPTLIGQFGAWGAYTASPGGKKICFVLSRPTSMKTDPPNRPRDPAYAFVSTRPHEKVDNEVSVMVGYPLKPGSEGSVQIGDDRFAMYTQDDGLWIKNAAEEDKLVDAMRKGADATVRGTSSRGTDTTDVYSLKGLTQALEKIEQTCK